MLHSLHFLSLKTNILQWLYVFVTFLFWRGSGSINSCVGSFILSCISSAFACPSLVIVWFHHDSKGSNEWSSAYLQNKLIPQALTFCVLQLNRQKMLNAPADMNTIKKWTTFSAAFKAHWQWKPFSLNMKSNITYCVCYPILQRPFEIYFHDHSS